MGRWGDGKAASCRVVVWSWALAMGVPASEVHEKPHFPALGSPNLVLAFLHHCWACMPGDSDVRPHTLKLRVCLAAGEQPAYTQELD